jgi:anti-sigma B factor antagonist
MHDGRFLIELTSGVPVVTAPEEIDMANAAELELTLQEAVANGPGTLVADLTLTRFCDSAGIRTLLAAHQRAQADGGELLLVVPDAAVLRVFAIIGIDRLIPHFSSLDDALEQSRPAQSQVGLNRG